MKYLKIITKAIALLVLAGVGANAAEPQYFNLSPAEIVASINQKMRAVADETNTSYDHLEPPKIASDIGGKKFFSSTYVGGEKDITTLLMFETSQNGKVHNISIASMSGYASPGGIFLYDSSLALSLIQTLNPKSTVPKTRAYSGDIMNEMIKKMKTMRNGRLSVSSDNVKYKLEISESNTQSLGKIWGLEIDATPLR